MKQTQCIWLAALKNTIFRKQKRLKKNPFLLSLNLQNNDSEVGSWQGALWGKEGRKKAALRSVKRRKTSPYVILGFQLQIRTHPAMRGF